MIPRRLPPAAFSLSDGDGGREDQTAARVRGPDRRNRAMTGAARIERRAAVEVRAASGRRLVGLAAPFNSPTQIGGFREVILPGSFRASLASGADVRALVDHDDDKLLGRTRSGTLRLAETGKGLEFELDVPDTQLGRDTLTMAQRGDLSGCSFGFIVPPGAITGQPATRASCAPWTSLKFLS